MLKLHPFVVEIGVPHIYINVDYLNTPVRPTVRSHSLAMKQAIYIQYLTAYRMDDAMHLPSGMEIS